MFQGNYPVVIFSVIGFLIKLSTEEKTELKSQQTIGSLLNNEKDKIPKDLNMEVCKLKSGMMTCCFCKFLSNKFSILFQTDLICQSFRG